MRTLGELGSHRLFACAALDCASVQVVFPRSAALSTVLLLHWNACGPGSGAARGLTVVRARVAFFFLRLGKVALGYGLPRLA